jgi:hypothetical protein
MPKAYSLDLRERVASFVDSGWSRHAAAAHFKVSVSFVVNLMKAYLIGQRCPRDMECKEKPRDHDAARGNQGVMDTRPSAAGVISPEQYGGPQGRNRAENAEPCEDI